jgi:PIN domain nuclease of toxin-antitoxin system
VTAAQNLLLDTCALLFLANDDRINAATLQQVSDAAYDGRLHVSPVSAWEIGIGVSKGKIKLPAPPLDFFDGFVERMQAKLSPLTPAIMMLSSFLPGKIHGDPMDRMLVSTARALNYILVTSDGPILAYGREGHVRALAC